MQRRVHDLDGLRALEGDPPRQRLEQHGARREDVGARVDRVAEDLLRRHVARSAHDQAGPREVALQREGSARVARKRSSQAEVQELRPAGRQEDVRGLHVAVDHSLRVQRVERREHLPSQTHGLGQGQGPALQPLGERLAVEQLHRDEEPSRVLADLEDLAGMGVADAGRGAGFTPEALAALFVGLRDGLQGHAPAEARILGRIDDPHASLSQLVQDAVAADPIGRLGFARRDAEEAGEEDVKPLSRRSSQPARRARVGVRWPARSSS